MRYFYMFEGKKMKYSEEDCKENAKRKLEPKLFKFSRSKNVLLHSLNVKYLKHLHDYIIVFCLTGIERASLLPYEFQTLIVETAFIMKSDLKSNVWPKRLIANNYIV